MPILSDFLAGGSPQDMVYLINTEKAKWIVMLNKNQHVVRPNVHVDSGAIRTYEGQKVRMFRISDHNVIHLRYISDHFRSEGHEVETEIGIIQPEVLQKAKDWVSKVNEFYK